MKSVRFNTISALLAFSLGIISVWAVGSFIDMVSLSEQAPLSSQTALSVGEIQPASSSVKIEKTFALERKPHFDDYPVSRIYKGKIASLKLSRYDEPDRLALQCAIEHQEVN